MAGTRRYNLQNRRRREGKTNYKTRLQLLRSRKPRVVIRKSNTDVVVQLIEYSPDGDKVLASSRASQLSNHGWKHASSNLPAAYLAGFAAGSLAKKAKVTSAIVDIGLQSPSSRLFAAVKGVIDAGIDVPVSEDILPNEDRINGAHINDKLAADVEAVKKKVGA